MDNPENWQHRVHKTNKNNTICDGYHYTQKKKNNINKTWVLLQTTGHRFNAKIVKDITTRNSERILVWPFYHIKRWQVLKRFTDPKKLLSCSLPADHNCV